MIRQANPQISAPPADNEPAMRASSLEELPRDFCTIVGENVGANEDGGSVIADCPVGHPVGASEEGGGDEMNGKSVGKAVGEMEVNSDVGADMDSGMSVGLNVGSARVGVPVGVPVGGLVGL